MLCNCTGDQMSVLTEKARRFLRDEEGTALVEFAVVLPMMILVFAVIVEGARLMLSYQAAISGVRDATRYLSRVLPADICTSGGSASAYTAQLATIVRNSTSGRAVFPSAVTVSSVTPSVGCVSGTYRTSPAGVATVTAAITVNYPFSGVFSFAGGSVASVTTTITDSARIFGS